MQKLEYDYDSYKYKKYILETLLNKYSQINDF